MRPRPLDFFGPEDYYGQNVEEEIAYINKQQEIWDKEYAELSWWRKILYHLVG